METSKELHLVFDKAVNDAKKLKHEYVTLEHLIYAMLCETNFADSLSDLGADVPQIKKNLENHLKNNCDDILLAEEANPKKTHIIERVLNRAFTQALFMGKQDLELEDMMLSILSEKRSIGVHHLNESGITKQKYTFHIQKKLESQDYDEVEVNKDSSKALKTYTTNLNEQVREGKIDPVIGRDRELESIALSLGRRNKNNILLVGEPGVGKTAVAEGLAWQIENHQVPEFLEGYTVYNLDIGAMLAGSKYRGDFEERFKLVMAALKKQAKSIMFIDEAHMISGAGAGTQNSSTDLANMLKPALTKGDIKVMASTTWEEYRKYFEKDRALMRRFQRVTVDEPDPATTKLILKGIKKYYEKFHNATITDAAIDEAIKLTVKYQTDRKLPDKAIDVLDVACSRFKLKKDVNERVVDVPEIQFEISKMIGIPVENIAEKQTNVLKDLSDNIKKYVFGQDTAIENIVDKVLINQAGLKEDNKPVGSFVLMGPSGVGKTETAKQLAKQLGVKLIRFDMSEYQEKHSVAKLIGSPPGYVGFDDNAGQLITSLQENPNCVLLLDEIEKAHPDVSQILLQLMDDGRVTGSNGKTADATQCILLLTTNLGAAAAEKPSVGFGKQESTYEQDEFKRFFAPEFRNRLDGVVVYHKLDKNVMKMIVEKFLNQLRAKVSHKNITINAGEETIEYLIERGFDPAMGARPLERVINEHVKKSLSKHILFGDLRDGGTVNLIIKDKKLEVEVV